MALLKIQVLGSPILRQQTVPVETITDELRTLIDDMIETMYAARGIGLAAPQVGRSERVAVIDVEGDSPFAIINPQIVRNDSDLAKAEEGCLSIPDVYGDVARPEKVTVRAMDRDGREFELEAEGLLARCLQHEIDHLHGRLFLDYLSVLKRRSAMSKWERERAKYPSLRRTIDPRDLAEQHNEEAL